jgi:hypothetical protein
LDGGPAAGASRLHVVKDIGAPRMYLLDIQTKSPGGDHLADEPPGPAGFVSDAWGLPTIPRGAILVRFSFAAPALSERQLSRPP